MSAGRPFGSLLRDLRRAAGLTQEELAERARVGVRTLRDLETGRTARPQRSTVDLLATALELDETERKEFVVGSRGWPGETRIPRQRAREAVLMGWRVLSSDERASLCWLSVLPGRWSLELAARLLRGRAAADESTQDVAGLLDRLVALNLVNVVPGSPPSRYLLREAVRVFVSEQPEAVDAFAAASTWHAVGMSDEDVDKP